MDLSLAPEQQQLVDSFAALFEKHATSERVRAAEPLGFDPDLWRRVHEMGAVAMAVDHAAGGWGASALDLALVAEQLGLVLAPVPIVETQVAARLLARVGGGIAAPVLAAMLRGERVVTVALHPARDGRVALIPAGAIADDALVLDGDRLVLVPLADARTTVENLGSMPLADVDLGSVAPHVVASGAAVPDAFDAALDDFSFLTAAALVGIGSRSLEIGVEYVKQREAWGVPIGSFQAIAHRLADSATAIDGARLLAYEAAWAMDEDPTRHRELAAMAFAFASESARDATYWSLHFHGGYGFMMEYDVQQYYRRARAWANVFVDPRRAFGRVADARYGTVGAS